MNKFTFKCTHCNNWEYSTHWGDVSPRFCGNDKCELSFKKGKGRTTFKNNPDQLLKIAPVVKKVEVKAPVVEPAKDNFKKDKNKKK